MLKNESLLNFLIIAGFLLDLAGSLKTLTAQKLNLQNIERVSTVQGLNVISCYFYIIYAVDSKSSKKHLFFSKLKFKYESTV